MSENMKLVLCVSQTEHDKANEKYQYSREL